MKHQPQRANLGTQIKVPPLKRWTKKTLAQEDWDFAATCDAIEKAGAELSEATANGLIYRAFTWELDRELGSGNGPFDWEKDVERIRLVASKDSNCQLVLMRQSEPTVAVTIPPRQWFLNPQQRIQPLNEWDLADLAQYITPDTYRASRGTNFVCALEIPWSEDEDGVVESFRLWLRRYRGGKAIGKAGRPYEWEIRFLDLAIYRLSVAAYQRKECVVKLEGFFKALERKEYSPPNFSRAKRMIRKEILRRFRELKDKAKRLSRTPSQNASAWRSHFLKQ